MLVSGDLVLISTEKRYLDGISIESSFHVALKVESSIMMSIIGDLMKADSWPAGILVRRFFKAKHDES